MTLLKRISVLMMIIAALVVAEDKAKSTEDYPLTKDGKEIAATAGEDITVTVAEVEALVEPRLQSMPEEAKATQGALMKKRALDSILFQKLLEKKFEENNIVVEDAQLDSEIEKILADNQITVEEFKKRVAEMGRDFNEFRNQVKSGMQYQKMMDKLAGDSLNISDEDVKSYFDENAARFDQAEEVKASHILVKFDPEATDEEKAAAKAKIETIKKKADGGEDFAELAKENSDCPSGQNGGDLGFFTRERMVQPFSEAAFKLNKGQISDVVETQFGYHIILVTDKKEAKKATFDDVKDEIKQQLQDGKRREFAGKFRDDLLKSSNIVYYDEFATEQPKPEAIEIKPKTD